MAPRSLLQIVQTACDEVGIPRPAAVVSSMDASAQQLLALANRDGLDLALRQGSAGGWQQLRKEYLFSTVPAQAGYEFPADLAYFLNTTPWDRTQKWPMAGPVTPSEWQVLKSGTIGSVGPRTRFRVMSNLIYLDPVPTTAHQIVLEYSSNSWVSSADESRVSVRWQSDSDVPLLPDDALVMGLIWRYLRAKRLDYAEEFAMCEEYINQTLGRAGMAQTLSLTGSPAGVRLLDEDNIPDSGYGV
jgi:hypothetical protein